MTTLHVNLADLRPGVRYSFKNPGNQSILEGTFVEVDQVPGEDYNQYVFSNVKSYNPDTKTQTRMGRRTYAHPTRYPYDIFVVAFTELPSDLNSYINAFGKKRKSTQRKRKSNLRKIKSNLRKIKSNLRSKRYRK